MTWELFFDLVLLVAACYSLYEFWDKDIRGETA